MTRPTLIGSRDLTTSLQLVINSERQLKEIRTQTKAELAVPRHNLRLYVPLELLEGCIPAELKTKDVHDIGFNLEIFPTSLFRISVAEKQDGSRTPGILHLIEGKHEPYLQKGLADSCYFPWVEKFKTYAQFDSTAGKEGWWVRGVASRVKGSFVLIGGTGKSDV